MRHLPAWLLPILLVFLWGCSVQRITAPRRKALLTASSAQTYAARTDFNFIPLPSPLPNVGDAHGAGDCITEPGYAAVVCRATDIGTLNSTSIANWQEFSTCCGGWADINAWNSDSTMFLVENNGGGHVLMSWDAATKKAAPLYTALLTSAAVWWSYSNPGLVYGLSSGKDPVISSTIYSNPPPPSQPTSTTIVDLATAPNCLSALKGITQWKELAVSHDEKRFIVAASSGNQDTAHLIAVWDVTQGCRWLDTLTGQVGGNWGPQGTVSYNPTGGYNVHAVRISGDGKTAWVAVAAGSPCAADCFNSAFHSAWNIDSLTVTIGAQTNKNNTWMGHYAVGYSGVLHNIQYSGDLQWCNYAEGYHPFSNDSIINYVTPTRAQCATGAALTGDQHQSWNNDDSTDLQPVFASTETNPLGTPPTLPWEDEVLAFSMQNPGTTWRFFSTYNTEKSPFFTCSNSIGTVSQDGRYFIFTSDWGATLGSDAAGQPRCDVFVAVLPLQGGGAPAAPTNVTASGQGF